MDQNISVKLETSATAGRSRGNAHRHHILLVGGLLLGAGALGAGIVVTDRQEEHNTFCTACHLHELCDGCHKELEQ